MVLVLRLARTVTQKVSSNLLELSLFLTIRIYYLEPNDDILLYIDPNNANSGLKIDMRNMLGFLNQNLYHDYLNITNIMKLKRLDFREIYGVRSPDLLLTRENLMERIMLLITSYFCMGTELRFLKQMQVEGFEESLDSEFWHGKALELAIKFLPGDAPLVKHIVSSYQKHHSPTSEDIPEGSEVK